MRLYFLKLNIYGVISSHVKSSIIISPWGNYIFRWFITYNGHLKNVLFNTIFTCSLQEMENS